MAEEKPTAGERLPDEAKLRRYLLGTCPPEEVEEIELLILGDGAQPLLEVVEDELIEDYITGALDPSDRSSFEARLLRSQAVVEKVRMSAMLLSRQDVAEGLEATIAALNQKFQAARHSRELSEGERLDVTSTLGEPASPAGKQRLKGQQFGEYVLEEKIGQGGMAEVWKARHKVPGTPSPSEIGVSQPSLPPLTSPDPSSQTNIKGRIAAAILICFLLFVVSLLMTPPRRSRGIGSLSLDTPSPSVVIYMRRFTTEKQIEDFRSSVLAQAGRTNELPSFVSSYHQLAPDHLWGRWAIIIMLNEGFRSDEVESYVEKIKRDGRVDHVNVSGFQSRELP
jgi:hypothetical protein